MPEYFSICERFEVDLTQDNDAPQRGIETPNMSGTITIASTMDAETFTKIVSALNLGASIIYSGQSDYLTDILIQGAIDGE